MLNPQLIRGMTFANRIKRMNEMMELPCPNKLTAPPHDRVHQFQNVLGDELGELTDSIDQCKPYDADTMLLLDGVDMVAYADCLGDMTVFIRSEAARCGIPLEQVVSLIMDSQDSKLDENGKPIKAADGSKFLKGPNYRPPEPAIKKLLEEHLSPVDKARQ